MKKVSLLVSMTLLLLVGFSNNNSVSSNEEIQSNIATANQTVTIEDSTHLGESSIVRSIKGIEDSLKGVENSLSEIESDITGDIETLILVITALFALGFTVLKVLPQATYLHKFKLKDYERLSYDLSNPNTRDKYSLYIIFAVIAIMILIIVTGGLIYFKEFTKLIILSIVVALIVYTIYLKAVEKERKNKVLTVDLNNNEDDIWFLFKHTEEGGFIFSKALYNEGYAKETIKNPTEKDLKNIKITTSMPKFKYLSKKDVIESFYGYAEVNDSGKLKNLWGQIREKIKKINKKIQNNQDTE